MIVLCIASSPLLSTMKVSSRYLLQGMVQKVFLVIETKIIYSKLIYKTETTPLLFAKHFHTVHVSAAT